MRLRTITNVTVLLLAAVFTLPLGAADWMQWRGSNHDGVSTETGLLKSWAEGGPKLLWKSEDLGVGYSNLTFHDGKIYSMGDKGGESYLYAIDAKTGEGLWSIKVGATGGSRGNTFHGPRCTPATDGKLIFAIGQFGDVVCADAQTGKEFWRVNVAETLGGNVMKRGARSDVQWDFSMSPIIDSDRVVLQIGGEGGTVIAWEKSGDAPKILWRSRELTDGAAYTSVVPMTVAGVYQYIVLTTKRVAGLDPKSGSVLWQAPFPGNVAVCSDPVLWIDGETSYLMAASGYGTGARGYKVTRQGDAFSAEEIWSEPRFESLYGGLVQVGGYFYMLTQRELVCVDPKTGKSLWSNRSVGQGSIFAVDGALIVRSEGGDGTVALVTTSPNGYEERSRFDQPNRTDQNSLTYPTVHDGKLYIRDQHQLFCYDVK